MLWSPCFVFRSLGRNALRLVDVKQLLKDAIQEFDYLSMQAHKGG